MIPAELQSPPPRPLSSATVLLGKNKSSIRSLYLGALCMPLLMVALCWLRFGNHGIMYGIYFGLGLGALVAFMGFAMQVNTKRSEELFCNGTAVEATIVKLQAPGDRNKNAYLLFTVEFADALGGTFTGTATTLGKTGSIDKKVGDKIAVLYKKEAPDLFAIYYPGVGIMSGKLKKTG
jgi:hypothetical protein